MKSIRIGALAVAAMASACGGSVAGPALDGYPSAKLETASDATLWAQQGSAPNVHNAALMPLVAIGLVGLGDDADPNCPKRTQDGNTVKIEGNCTDKDGTKWMGSAEQASEAAGSQTGRYTYKKFGFERSVSCNGQTGTSTLLFEGQVTETGTSAERKFDVDVRMDVSGLDEASCTNKTGSAAWDYQGTIRQSGQVQTWSGSGRVGSSELGVASVETKDEVLDQDACGNEAASGSTTIKGGSNTVVITYDGATDCDTESTAQWSLNGEAKGELTGIRCSAAGGMASGAWAGLMFGALAMLRGRRRR